MERLHRFCDRMSDLGMAASVAVVVAMASLILTEVTLRTLFATSTYVMDELIGYGIAAASFLALGQSLARGGLIRMNLLIGRMRPGGPLRAAVEVVCVAFGLFATGMALFYFARNMVRNYVRGYVSETIAQVPLWLPEVFVVAGLAIFLLQLFSYLIRILTGSADLDAERAVNLRSD